MPAQYVMKTAKSGQTYFNLLAANGEVVLTSQMYSTKSSAKNGIRSVQANASESGRYEECENTSGKHYFVVKAANHQIIGTSQAYKSKAAMQKGMKAVQKAGSTQKVEDAT